MQQNSRLQPTCRIRSPPSGWVWIIVVSVDKGIIHQADRLLDWRAYENHSAARSIHIMSCIFWNSWKYAAAPCNSLDQILYSEDHDWVRYNQGLAVYPLKGWCCWDLHQKNFMASRMHWGGVFPKRIIQHWMPTSYAYEAADCHSLAMSHDLCCRLAEKQGPSSSSITVTPLVLRLTFTR